MLDRTAPEPLTIAYIAKGVADIIAGLPGNKLPDAVSESYGGELNFMQAVVDHALMLDRMADEYGGELDGVFVYEIAEPFGVGYAAALIGGGPNNDPRLLASALFAEMMRAGSCSDCVRQ